MNRPKTLSELSEKEVQSYYQEHVLDNIRKIGYKPVTDSQISSSLYHDCWSLYDYGGFYRLVYIKRRQKRKTPQRGKRDNLTAMSQITDSDEPERLAQSINRAKARIFELAMCNEFRYFCTFTQDEKLRDRFDLAEFRKDLAQFVRNQNRSRSADRKIRYLLIPEEHKNGAWHMHGLLAGLDCKDLRAFTLREKLPEKIREQLKAGKAVYNWEKYAGRFGYFTCTEADSREGCARYCTKYITKALAETARGKGEHLFFASQGLKSRTAIVRDSCDTPPICSGWDFENNYIAVKDFRVTECDKI